MITIVSAVPWLIALLPLTLNGMQQVEESGGTGDGSFGLGITMLALAALPVVTALSVLAVGLLTRVRFGKAGHLAAATLFVGGMTAFLFASLLATA
ncbi:hypothetical protein [Streptomyces sp. WMMC940]|uniref:hypothetical protein n=1 Tax=Streptomyces sp. WMMC940 TaxID=3015153 RepID=UPI0022B6A46F|nr:hypothetical protein [Streptomyces sp. WMMC940]MCZ7456748.1 hypothetical protein [Streptomyces sp. WMMC940]